MAQRSRPERAVELGTLALTHPASIRATRNRAGAILEELRGQLAPEQFAAAEERGRAGDLEAAMAELLGDWSRE